VTPPVVAVVRTGAANLASVRAALERRGLGVALTADPAIVRSARLVVLPGVGSFAPAMASLEASGLRSALRDRAEAGAPLLAICLGLQLLLDGSDEGPGTAGLGVARGVARRFTDDVRVPQLGWNAVDPAAPGLVQPGHAYYANSYRLGESPDGWDPSWTDHGGRFVAAIQRGPVLACQFHPELSGPWGAALLQRWIDAGLAATEGSLAC